MRNVAVLGASGYTGGELLRILAAHPDVQVTFAAAHASAGKRVADVHPYLRGLVDLELQRIPETTGDWPDVDLIFLALPHGESMAVVPRLPKGVRVIDLGGDFRLKEPATFARWYGRAHTATTEVDGFVYGLPELGRDVVAKAHRIANPGCFATATILALAPLVNEALVEPRVVVDAKTGSSGSGAKPGQPTHHPERSEGFTAYKPFKHQHVPEITQALAGLTGGFAGDLLLQAHSAPMVRGIYATAYAQLKKGHDGGDVAHAFRSFYEEAPFVRLLDAPPNVHWVRGGNFVDIAWAVDGRDVVVFAAIDNLGKGAAGQAVQNMNLMLGLEETSGLWRAGGYP